MLVTDPTYPLFSIFAFIGFIISLIPLPWHLQAWNSGTCFFMMWSSLACLNQFVNSVVWAGNAINHSPGWCEISIRILLASSVGIPASSLCINRRLYKIASARAVSYGPDERFRALVIDSLICVLFPLIYVAMQYIVQGHRFDIFEDIGCFPALFNTIPTFFINGIWPIVIGLISASYCVRSLWEFARRRLEFSQFMKSNKSSLTMARYFRLMALATSEILFTTPLASFSLYLNTELSPVRPWKSWEDTHFGYERIRQIPASLWRSDRTHVISLEFTRWLAPLCALVFFAFFGFGDEARKNYFKFFCWITQPFRKDSLPSTSERKICISSPKMPIPPKQSYAPSSILPAYSPPSLSPTVLDIKRESSCSATTTRRPTSRYDELCSTINEKDIELGLDTPTVQPSENRSSWQTIFIPLSDRRHSSYF